MLAERGVGFDACEPAAAGEMELSVRAALREGYGTIAVVGGDGTLGEAARGFFESADELAKDDDDALPASIAPRAALAILPAGTGNDFARGLTQKRAPLEMWLERLVAHCRPDGDGPEETTRPVDVLYATVDGGARRFVCLNAATLGIGADVASRVAAQGSALRRLSGEARFALAATGALIAWRNRAVRIEVDEDYLLECATNLVAVANGPFAGGGMHFAPEAASDDGRLEVVTACGVSRAGVVRELARIHRSGHLANPKVRLKSGTRARIQTIDEADPLRVEADGDVRGHTPATFRIMPRALRIVRAPDDRLQ
jgi:diacylglycerol kinase family enzyme